MPVDQGAMPPDELIADLHRRHGAALRRYVARLLRGTSADPDDVVQDALLRALRALRSGKVPQEPHRWLYAIARNCAWDARSAAARTAGAVELDDAPADVLATAPEAVPAAVERGERLATTVAHLQDLPAAQRDALVLRTFAGASHQEIADHLDRSAPAVKSLLNRARTALAERAAAAVALPLLLTRRLRDLAVRVPLDSDRVLSLPSPRGALAVAAAGVATAVPAVGVVPHVGPAQAERPSHAAIHHARTTHRAAPSRPTTAARPHRSQPQRTLAADAAAAAAACRAGRPLDGRWSALALTLAARHGGGEYDDCATRLATARPR